MPREITLRPIRPIALIHIRVRAASLELVAEVTKVTRIAAVSGITGQGIEEVRILSLRDFILHDMEGLIAFGKSRRHGNEGVLARACPPENDGSFGGDSIGNMRITTISILVKSIGCLAGPTMPTP
jgi:hypothetical protein